MYPPFYEIISGIVPGGQVSIKIAVDVYRP